MIKNKREKMNSITRLKSIDKLPLSWFLSSSRMLKLFPVVNWSRKGPQLLDGRNLSIEAYFRLRNLFIRTIKSLHRKRTYIENTNPNIIRIRRKIVNKTAKKEVFNFESVFSLSGGFDRYLSKILSKKNITWWWFHSDQWRKPYDYLFIIEFYDVINGCKQA